MLYHSTIEQLLGAIMRSTDVSLSRNIRAEICISKSVRDEKNKYFTAIKPNVICQDFFVLAIINIIIEQDSRLRVMHMHKNTPD